MMRRLGFLLLLLLVGCGQEGAGIGQSASAVLDPQVQQVRAAASNGDPAGAARELAELRQTVAGLRQRGELSESAAAKVLAAAAEVEAQLAGITPATQVAPTISGQREPAATAREAEEEARKRAEEAAKKAQDEAKKRADDAKKKAEQDKDDD